MQLYCPMCREPNANVKLSLVDGDTFTCEECGDDFTREDVAALISAAAPWIKVLEWADACPAHKEAATV